MTEIVDVIPAGFFVCESCGEVVDARFRVFIEEDGILWPICTTCATTEGE